MNKITAIVKSVQTHNELHLVKFTYQDAILSLVSLDINVKTNQACIIGFKPTAVAIGKDFQGHISYANQLECTIFSVEFGEILTHIKASFKDLVLQSTITTASAKRLKLKKDDKITMFIKSTDIFVVEKIDEH